MNDGGLVFQPLVLAEIKIAEDNDHAEFVGLVDDAFEPAEIIRAQRAVGFDGGNYARVDLASNLSASRPANSS